MHFSTSATSVLHMDPSIGGIFTIRSRLLIPNPQVTLQGSHSPHSVTTQLLGAVGGKEIPKMYLEPCFVYIFLQPIWLTVIKKQSHLGVVQHDLRSSILSFCQPLASLDALLCALGVKLEGVWVRFRKNTVALGLGLWCSLCYTPSKVSTQHVTLWHVNKKIYI